jgi:hypothetical protein
MTVVNYISNVIEKKLQLSNALTMVQQSSQVHTTRQCGMFPLFLVPTRSRNTSIKSCAVVTSQLVRESHVDISTNDEENLSRTGIIWRRMIFTEFTNNVLSALLKSIVFSMLYVLRTT